MTSSTTGHLHLAAAAYSRAESGRVLGQTVPFVFHLCETSTTNQQHSVQPFITKKDTLEAAVPYPVLN